MKYIFPALFILAGVFLWWASRPTPGGTNTNTILILPAGACGIVGVLWALAAWAL